MADVKMLVRGTAAGNFAKGKKGDIWAITPGDFGTAEVAPDWLQVTITGVPGTQAEANALINNTYLRPYSSGFTVSEVSAGRYRVEILPELGTVATPIFNTIRNGIEARFGAADPNGSQQNRVWFEFDANSTGIPLDEIQQEIDTAIGDARRYQLDPNIVDNALGSFPAGSAAPYTMAYADAPTELVDKLG